MSRGGKRPGAGRPKKYAQREMFGHPSGKSTDTQADSTRVYDTAEAYLAAVAQGIESPDPARISAAKALLPYQNSRTRAPLAAASKPKALQAAKRADDQSSAQEQWRQKAAEIRARHGRTNQE